MAKAKKETSLEKSSETDLDTFDGEDMFENFSVEDYLKKGFSTETIKSLKEGQGIRGIFLGEGGGIDVSDPNDPTKTNRLKTWRIRRPAGGVVVSLLGASQLDSRLGGLQPGTAVVIQHHGRVKTTKGRFANDYLIMTGPVQAL